MDRRILPHVPLNPQVPLNPLRPDGAAVTDLVFWLHADFSDAGSRSADPRVRLDISGDGFALAGLTLDLDTAVEHTQGVAPRYAARRLSAPSRDRRSTLLPAHSGRIVKSRARPYSRSPPPPAAVRAEGFELEKHLDAADRKSTRLEVVAEFTMQQRDKLKRDVHARPQAEQEFEFSDLDECGAYLAKHGSLKVAMRFLEQAEATLATRETSVSR